MIMPSAGVHVTLPDYYSPEHLGMIVPKTKDGRVVFMLPWQEATIAGTTGAWVPSSCPAAARRADPSRPQGTGPPGICQTLGLRVGGVACRAQRGMSLREPPPSAYFQLCVKLQCRSYPAVRAVQTLVDRGVDLGTCSLLACECRPQL